jgi:hypothetical protein
MVKDINKEGVTIESGGILDHLTARTVIWAGGNSASSLGQILAHRTNAETDKGGRVKVRPDLTIPNFPESASGFSQIGIPGLNVQSWSAAYHRDRPDGF